MGRKTPAATTAHTQPTVNTAWLKLPVSRWQPRITSGLANWPRKVAVVNSPEPRPRTVAGSVASSHVASAGNMMPAPMLASSEPTMAAAVVATAPMSRNPAANST